MISQNIQTLIDNASTSVNSVAGANLGDFFNLGFYFVKLALGAVVGFVATYWPIELVVILFLNIMLFSRLVRLNYHNRNI